MATRGRPPLTEEAVRQRIAEYCARYGVASLNRAGLPAFPAGKRESRQHREWIVLYKALRRLQDRQAGPSAAGRLEAHRRQRGRCPICLEEVGASDRMARHTTSVPVLVHAACDQMLRGAAKLGPEGLDRLKAHLWPDHGKGGARRAR